MNINALITTLADAIVDQAEIAAWSTTQYGHGYTVCENVDLRDPPPSGDCPLVVISHGAKSTGLVDQKMHIVGADILVYDERKTTQANGVVRYEGGYQAEVFRQFALEKIVAAVPTNLKLDAVAISYDPISQFPYVFIDMELTLTEENVIGVNPYE